MEPAELDHLRRVAESVAGVDTAAFRALYERSAPKYGPLLGHCHALASWVQSRAGGLLVVGSVPVDKVRCWHWWNELPDGRQIDLMSDYFGVKDYDPAPGAVCVIVILRANLNPTAYRKRNLFRARADAAIQIPL